MWPFAQRPYLVTPTITDSVKQRVTGNVIEFYVPKNFRNGIKRASEMGFGKIIEFRLPAKKSA